MNPGTPHYPEPGTLTLGVPDRWYPGPHTTSLLKCTNGHILVLDVRSAEACPLCRAETDITYPEARPIVYTGDY